MTQPDTVFKWFKYWFLFCATLGLGLLGLFIYVIIKILNHFGIL